MSVSGLHMDFENVSLVEQLERVGRLSGGLIYLDEKLAPTYMTYNEFARHAEDAAYRLRHSGVRPGDRICVQASTTLKMVIALYGSWRLGAVPIVLPRHRRGNEAELRAELARRATIAEAVAVLTDERSVEPFAPSGTLNLSLGGLDRLPRAAGVLPEPAADSLATLQFTSGTTAVAKAVPVRQGQILGNIWRIMQHSGVDRDRDSWVTWLPLYHDMGIVSTAGSIAHGLPIVIMATETFMQQPSAWMQAISTHRGTVTAAPNFAYALAARLQQLRPALLDLSCLRVAFNGAEQVTTTTLDRTIEVLRPVGLAPEALCPTYGMAEATLAVTMTKPTERFHAVARPDSSRSPDEQQGPSLVSCGVPLSDTDVEVRTADGAILPEDAVGEVWVRGPGVMTGYWRPGTTGQGGEGVVDGWLPTGDLGFLRSGELYICGRAKDMIIVGGRNLYPEDYEALAEQEPQVHPGSVTAFPLSDIERMVVIVEAHESASRGADFARHLADTFRVGLERAPHEILVIRPGGVPRTSSGKRQRALCRQMYLQGEFTAVAGWSDDSR